MVWRKATAALKRWWGEPRPFLTIKSAEGSRTPVGDVTREEYEAWRDRIRQATADAYQNVSNRG